MEAIHSNNNNAPTPIYTARFEITMIKIGHPKNVKHLIWMNKQRIKWKNVQLKSPADAKIRGQAPVRHLTYIVLSCSKQTISAFFPNFDMELTVVITGQPVISINPSFHYYPRQNILKITFVMGWVIVSKSPFYCNYRLFPKLPS